jgi:protease-4
MEFKFKHLTLIFLLVTGWTAPITILRKITVGLLSIEGEIDNTFLTLLKLHALAQNPQLKALVVTINSPGGRSASGEWIYDSITEIKNKIPVFVFIDHAATSAAYHIAAAGTYVAAGRDARIGSIGSLTIFNKNAERIILRSAEYCSPYEIMQATLNPTHREYMEQRNKNFYHLFCEQIAAARNIPVEKIKAQEARIYTSQEAYALTLIDGIHTFSEMAQLIGTRVAPEPGEYLLEFFETDDKKPLTIKIIT